MQVIDRLDREDCGGFYTVEVHDASAAQDTRMGFRLVTLDGQSGMLAHVMLVSPLHMGRYGINLDCLQTIGLAAIDRALAVGKLIIVDELGPMQACSEPFKMKLMDILQHDHLLVGTIASAAHPWLDMKVLVF
jgi:nucleoside-triphosphatase